MDNEPVQRQAFQMLLDAMWADYTTMNPQARSVYELFRARGEDVRNDHIAFRTFGLEPVSISSLERTFVSSGYEMCGSYEFPAKRLRARHYEPPVDTWPKIFISELKVDELQPRSRDVVRRLVAQVDGHQARRFGFCAAGRPWRIRFEDYETLAEDSEYAAWVAAFGFRPNHFTVDVGALKTLTSIQEVNALLEHEGFVLNTSGGAVKGSPSALLEQSSVMANRIDVAFDDGARTVPGCYYEFAKRYPGPDGLRYQGFLASSADRIFESTNAR